MENKRYAYLDMIRVIAIISVVVDHTVIVGYRLFYDGLMDWWAGTDAFQQLAMCFLWEFSRLGVPLFLMITGALILNKDFSTKDAIIRFYRHNLIPLIVINMVWVVIYRMILLIYHYYGIPFIYSGFEIELTWKSFISQLLFFTRADYPNSWYIPMIIGMYIFLPMVSIVIHNIDKKLLNGLLLLIAVLSFVFPSINTVLKVLDINFAFSSALVVPFGGGAYGMLIILGYVLNRNDSKIYTWGGVFLLALLSIISVTFMWYTYYIQQPVNLFSDNNSFLQLLICICIFTTCKCYVRNQNKMILGISGISFWIFLSHYPLITFIDYILFQATGGIENRTLLTVLLTMFSFCASVVLYVIIPKTPIIRTYVIHCKQNKKL